MKRVLRVLLVVIVILVIVGFAARHYLASSHMAAQVTSRLEAAWGLPVSADAVDIALSTITLTGVRLYEKEPADSPEPWLTVDALKADVSALSLLGGGSSPRNVTLTGAAVNMRFDKEGHLLTRLPSWRTEAEGKEIVPPNLTIERGRITFRKEGAADLIIKSIDATMQTNGAHVELSGAAGNRDEAGLGAWTLQGAFDPQAKAVSVACKSDQPLHVTQALLNQIPFIPGRVWQAVRLEGDTPVAASFRYDLSSQATHYRVDLEPSATHVYVPAIDLDATQASGKVIIDDGLVELRDVSGQAFEGTIRTNADLDFRKAVTRLNFSQIEVQGLNMRLLPESWGLPRQIEGRLKGSAWLNVLLLDGKPRTRGEGQGEIDGARVGGQPAAEPVRLELHAKEGGFGFRNRQENVPRKEPPPAARLLKDSSPGLAGPPRNFTRPGSAAGWLTAMIKPPLRKPPQQERYVEVNLKMQRVDLAFLVKGLGIKLPVTVAGRLSFDVRASIPLDTPRDMKTYRLKGTAQVAGFRLAAMELDEVGGKINYENGVLDLREMTARVDGQTDFRADPAGALRGTARMELVPLGNLTADVNLDRVPLSRMAGLVGATRQARGELSGSVAARAPVAKLSLIDAWEANAKITAKRIMAFGWNGPDSAADIHLLQGLLSLALTRAEGAATPITGSAEVRLANPYRYRGSITLRDIDLSAFQSQAPGARPPMPIAGHVTATFDMHGTLQPLSVFTTGTGTATDLKVSGVILDNVAFRWESDNVRVTISELHARLYEGVMDGKAVIPLWSPVAGDVDLRLKDFDMGALAKALPMPFGMEGRAGGRLTATFAPAVPGKERMVTWELNLQAPRLRVQGIPAEQLQGKVSYHQGTVDYRFVGKTLGGGLELLGQMPAPGGPVVKGDTEGSLRVERAKLSNVSQILHLAPETFPLRGLADLEIKFRHDGPDRAPVGNGRFVVTRLRWGATPVAESIEGDVVLNRQELRLREITASVGEGLLRAQLAFNLHRLDRSWFTLSLERVQAAEILGAWPTLAGKIQGQLDAHLRGRLGREWTGTGDLFMGRGRVLGMEIADWRLPLTWSFAPSAGRGNIAFPDSSAHLAQGRVTGQANLKWETGLHLDGHVLFYNMELSKIPLQEKDTTQFASGRVTGHLDFAGTDVRSADDLTATLRATLARTQAFQLPVLQQVAPFLGIQTSSTFDNGELRARLSRGVIRIQDFSLRGSAMQVDVEGNLTLSGRVDLDVTGKASASALDLASLRLLGYLTNRLLRLRVTGTTRNPTIRIEPLASRG